MHHEELRQWNGTVETHVNEREYLPKNMSQSKFEILTLNFGTNRLVSFVSWEVQSYLTE
jgi:hypothetical protein